MQINIIGHGFDVTPTLKEFAEKKLQRLAHHCETIISIDLHFAVEKLQQTVKGTVYVKGQHLHADASSEDLYSAIDNLVDLLDRQLKRYREKFSNH